MQWVGDWNSLLADRISRHLNFLFAVCEGSTQKDTYAIRTFTCRMPWAVFSSKEHKCLYRNSELGDWLGWMSGRFSATAWIGQIGMQELLSGALLLNWGTSGLLPHHRYRQKLLIYLYRDRHLMHFGRCLM